MAASCSSCGKMKSCSCELIGGLCSSCYAKANFENQPPNITVRENKRRITKQVFDPNNENNEFVDIVKSSISQEEKLRRINEILSNAKKRLNDNQTVSS